MYNILMIDNIVIGNLLVHPERLGILDSEQTICLSFDEVKNDNGELFLPSILKQVGIFQSTSQIRQINKQRMNNDKFKNDPDQNLWRNLDRPEMTMFKVGKNVFWLFVGTEQVE